MLVLLGYSYLYNNENIKNCDSPLRVIAKVMDCSLEVIEFKLLSRYYVHFPTNTLGKSKSAFIPLAVG